VIQITPHTGSGQATTTYLYDHSGQRVTKTLKRMVADPKSLNPLVGGLFEGTFRAKTGQGV